VFAGCLCGFPGGAGGVPGDSAAGAPQWTHQLCSSHPRGHQHCERKKGGKHVCYLLIWIFNVQ